MGAGADGGLGTVSDLRRYPVKSMLGEDLTACGVTVRGLAGDRVMALVHRETGKVASAKNPRLWRGLLQLHAALAGPAVKITFPGGAVMAGTDPGIDAALSEFLERPVTLAAAPPPGAALDRADPEEVLRDGIHAQVRVESGQLGGASPAGTFFDYAPLHLLTTSTLDRIAALSPRGTVEVERYRPNIVIRTSAPGFAENDWVGRDLRIGPDLTIRVILRSPRCAIPTLEHGDLPRDLDALRVPAAHNRISPVDAFGPQPCAGVYAQVLRPGRIKLGDIARLA
jgi:MOSC domain-containing protein